MKDAIKQMMVDYFKTCSVDKYGQTRVAQPSSVFKDKTEDVLEYLKSDKIITIKTYGWQYGTYEGFSLAYDVNDEDIRIACYDSLNENESYKWAMSH